MSGFAYRIDSREGYLFVWQKGLPTIADLKKMQVDIEQAMRKTGVRLLLTDNREMDTPDEEARGFMIKWFDQPGFLDAIAMVMHSTLIVVRTNMDALARRTRRRGFNSIAEAEEWLRSKAG